MCVTPKSQLPNNPVRSSGVPLGKQHFFGHLRQSVNDNDYGGIRCYLLYFTIFQGFLNLKYCFLSGLFMNVRVIKLGSMTGMMKFVNLSFLGFDLCNVAVIPSFQNGSSAL